MNAVVEPDDLDSLGASAEQLEPTLWLTPGRSRTRELETVHDELAASSGDTAVVLADGTYAGKYF
jgi:hypothetical protein